MPPTTPPSPSRRERPAKPALTYEGIVATAVRLMAEEGLGRVTMRRLARELDTGPASLYVYVANTEALHAAILEQLLGEVDLRPAAEAGEWRERLVTVLVSYTEVLFRHPSLARAALVARPAGRNYLALLEALLALLDEGGVPAPQAAWGVDVLLQVATATAAEHSAGGRPEGGAEEWEALVAALREVDPAGHPRLTALGGDLLSGAPRTRLAWYFRVLANGILHTPRADG
ncbi:TetR/AcrR family transcriptional regulator [Streptomyces sp. NPDC059740]|uniref:TetR/AcrR family transcriptional regulator n=1 Tax=Streptomyces sp. NPDC059740 TaxID=3346926 RepID=UPI00364FD595